MAWNDDNGKKDPWSGRDNQSPPELNELFNKLFKNRKTAGSGPDAGGDNKGLGLIVSVIIALVVLIWAASGIFVVPPTNQSVVLRLGKYYETLQPGIHWIPQLIDSEYSINVQNQNFINYSAQMLTEDENIVQVSVAVQYRVADPRKFLFSTVDPVSTLKQATSSAVRQVVGDMTLDNILTVGRQMLGQNVDKHLKAIMTNYDAGIDISDVNLTSAKPPSQVTDAFDDAVKAREDKQKYINQAEAYSNQVVSIAQGKASRLKQDADAYKQQVVLQAKGTTARYLALLSPYHNAPEVTRERMYFDTMSSILSHTTNIVDESHGKNILYLPLRHHSNVTSTSAASASSDASDTDSDTGSASDTGSSNSDAAVTSAATTSSNTDATPTYAANMPQSPYGGGY